MQGHIHKRTRSTKDGKQVTAWYVVVDLNRGPDGRRRQKWHGGFRTRRAAEVAKAKLVNEVHAGTYIEPGKGTLTDWVESSWLRTMRSQVRRARGTPTCATCGCTSSLESGTAPWPR